MSKDTQISSLVTMEDPNHIILNTSEVKSVKDAKAMIKYLRKFVLAHYKLKFSKIYQSVIEVLKLGGKL